MPSGFPGGMLCMVIACFQSHEDNVCIPGHGLLQPDLAECRMGAPDMKPEIL